MVHWPPQDLGESASVPALRAGLALGELSFNELCMGYYGMGGRLGPAQLRDALNGRARLSSFDHNMVAAVLNEHFLDRGLAQSVPYFDQLEGDTAPPERASSELGHERRLTEQSASETASVMHETAKLRADLAGRYDRLVQTCSGPARERYRERARHLRILAHRAERFANDAEVQRRRQGPKV